MERRNVLTRAKALFLAVAVLLAGAAPAAAAGAPVPDGDPFGVRAVLSWLVDWFPVRGGPSPDADRGAGLAPGDAARAGAPANLGVFLREGGGEDAEGGFETTSDDPTGDPERGGNLDPSG
ncbi:MAG: hypothetical protein ACLF0P_17490 [Thermoanaerobaculia bacterium]